MTNAYPGNELAQQTLDSLVNRRELGREGSRELILAMMKGEIDPQLIAANLVAWRMRGENPDEVLGAALAMRELSTKLELPLDEQPVIDLVGTGGDDANLFNVSTAACFVVAACGGRVAKHCGRGVSTSSGSVDLLSWMGVNLEASLEEQQARFASTGLAFMPAPNHHPAMRYTAPVRQTIKQRTIFNLLGPLTNPAGVRRYLLGVYQQELVEIMAKLLSQLGAERAMVAHSEDGLDEISIAAPTLICELDEGEQRTYTLQPTDLGVSGNLAGCRVENAEQSLAIIRAAFAGEHANAAKQIAANAGVALYLLDLANNPKAGVDMALERIARGGILPE